MPSDRLENNRHHEERRKAMSEAFHTFHQPLTSLHCGLELALLKSRSESDYRERLQEALVSAGAVLELTKAVRELAESTDPGDRFGTVVLAPLLVQVVQEVGSLTEPLQVRLLSEVGPAQVHADPMKLLAALANFLLRLACSLEPVSSIEVSVIEGDHSVLIRMEARGVRKGEEESSIELKSREIRYDAARSYIWTLGGDVTKLPMSVEVSLPQVD